MVTRSSCERPSLTVFQWRSVAASESHDDQKANGKAPQLQGLRVRTVHRCSVVDAWKAEACRDTSSLVGLPEVCGAFWGYPEPWFESVSQGGLAYRSSC
eukprot:15462004-Alexandrium_andersonii.AAC.1